VIAASGSRSAQGLVLQDRGEWLKSSRVEKGGSWSEWGGNGSCLGWKGIHGPGRTRGRQLSKLKKQKEYAGEKESNWGVRKMMT